MYILTLRSILLKNGLFDYRFVNILKIVDYRCHLIKCKKDNGVDPEGCIDFENTNVMSYKDQLKRDYPSFSQIKKIINENSK